MQTIFKHAPDSSKNNLLDFRQRYKIDCKGYKIILYRIPELELKPECEIVSAIKSYSDTSGRNILHWACIECNLNLVTFCLDIGININSMDKQGQSCLNFALCTHSIERVSLIKYLLQRGLDYKTKDFLGYDARDLIQRTRGLSTQDKKDLTDCVDLIELR